MEAGIAVCCLSFGCVSRNGLAFQTARTGKMGIGNFSNGSAGFEQREQDIGESIKYVRRLPVSSE